MAWNGSTLAVGGELGQLWTTSNVVDWTPHTTSTQGSIVDIATNGPTFVGSSLGFSNPDLVRSENGGASWTTAPWGTPPSSIGFIGQVFVLFESQTAQYSVDGISWSPVLPWSYVWMSATTSAGPRAVVVGGAGQILTVD